MAYPQDLRSALTRDDFDQLMDDAEHYNDSHPDTVLFVARLAGGLTEAETAQIVAVDEQGTQMRIRVGSGASREARVDFDDPATTLEAARAALHGLLLKARGAAGDDEPLTSLEKEILAVASLTTHQTSVTAVRDITPHMREITFGGGLDDYRPLPPDQFLLVMLPDADGGGSPSQAYYTVRRWRPDKGQIDMWFVLHDHDGPVSGWARGVEPGDPVALWGPRSSFDPPDGTSSLVLVADDTGVPAIAAILESSEVPAHVIIETYDVDHRVELGSGSPTTVQWLYRSQDEPGTGSRLVDAVKGLDVDRAGVYAFGAGESRQVTAIRKHLRHEKGMSAGNVQMTGYWRRAAASS